MLTAWKLDPYTVMRLNSGRRGDDVVKGGHLACISHKPLTSSYSPVTKRLQAGQDQGLCIVYPAKYYLRAFRCTDSVNSFRYKGIAAQTGGKRTAWSVLRKFEDGTPALRTLAQTPTAANIDEILPTIERLVILMYDKEFSENKARQTLFTQKGREICNIPPTKHAIRQYVLRAGYQAGHV